MTLHAVCDIATGVNVGEQEPGRPGLSELRRGRWDLARDRKTCLIRLTLADRIKDGHSCRGWDRDCVITSGQIRL